MACIEAYDNCLSGDGGPTITPSCNSNTFSGEPSTCTATVGDVQTCADDERVKFNQIYGPLPSCSSLTAARLAAAVTTFEADGTMELLAPASCKFEATCY
jgi:hypothetical protein